MLRKIGAELGFAVDVVHPVGVDGEPVSSSRIRRWVQERDLAAAREGLGRPYSFRGVVVRGEQRGRELGFPTANLSITGGDKLIPPEGIYAVRGVLRQGSWTGALHLGPRPTFKGSPPSIELHLLDFDGDIYGEEVRVDFIDFIRPIAPFTTVQALIDQIRADVDRAREVVEGGG